MANYNEEAEVMVLGSILKKSELMDDVKVILELDDFYLPINKDIYELCSELYEQNRLDVPTLIRIAKERGMIESLDYIRRLPLAVPTLHLAKFYAEKVKEQSVKRKALLIASELREIAENDYERLDELIGDINKKLTNIDIARTGNMRQVDEGMDEHINQKINGQKVKSPLIDLSEVDRWMNGIGRDRLIVVAGRPGTGKTAFSLRSARKVAAQSFGPVPFFSMEMGMEELRDRILADLSGVEFANINRNDLKIGEPERINQAKQHLYNLPLMIDDTPRMTMPYITAQCRKLKREYGSLGMIAIDYLGLIDRNQRKGESTTDAIGRMTRECKSLAREIGCSVMLMVQMNREIDKRSTKRPLLSDLRDSGNIEQDADMVIFLHKNEEKSTEKIAHIEMIVAKGRQTGLRDFNLAFYGEIQRITMAV
jgi:replicative DNA helicase